MDGCSEIKIVNIAGVEVGTTHLCSSSADLGPAYYVKSDAPPNEYLYHDETYIRTYKVSFGQKKKAAANNKERWSRAIIWTNRSITGLVVDSWRTQLGFCLPPAPKREKLYTRENEREQHDNAKVTTPQGSTSRAS